MMPGKVEIRPNRPRDGRHCDLCGCSQPAVRCDKCGCQIFCLSCDDMYHRHPKRRFHLRKAVDPTPPTPQARPVLPMKVSQMPTNPGDPSKMPLPPPRKKKPTKSFFDTFRRRSPSADHSPPLPKKEYSWTDRLGNIKKFMSNRPLPPLPTSNGADESELKENTQSMKNDLSFIHKRVDDKPPQLPQRSLKPAEFSRPSQEKENLPGGMPGYMGNDVRNGTLDPSQIMRHQEFNRGAENQWNNSMMNNNQANTLNRQFPPGGPGFPGSNMHQSASATDLQNLPGMENLPGMPPMHYPHYPMNPHLPPHYPYPMYPPPQFSNYPQYFGNSFANLSSQPTTTDGDFSDQSEASSRNFGRKYPFRKRAKRSQSVMVDRMQYPGQFFPFGPFPPGYGPGPWGAPFPMEAPPSPASSIRSLNRVGRTRRRKKLTSEDDDEEFSMSSSPLSRPKSSSSERPMPAQKSPSKPPKSTSSEEEESDDEDRRSGRVNRKDRTLRRNSDPKRLPSPVPKSPQVVHKKMSKHKQQDTLKHSDAENVLANLNKLERRSSKESNRSRYSDAEDMPASPARIDRRSSRESNPDPPDKEQSVWSPVSCWQCKHCTFINPSGNRICQVCCKTATPEESTLVSSRPDSASAGSRKHSLSSEKSCSSPEKRLVEEEDVGTSKDKQDMAVLNTALDEAEKEITRGLEELMKLKEDFKSTVPDEKPTSPNKPPTIPEASPSKPVYKSSGKLRTSILDKIIPPSKQSTASTSTSTETQTGSTSKSDRIVEARRPSTSSTTSDAYNSPTAQSPQLERMDMVRKAQKGVISKSGARKEMSCQTQPDDLMDCYDRKNVEEEGYLGNARYRPRYGDRLDAVQSPTSFVYDRGHGMMQRSHSRASLFTGRLNDFGPMEYGFGARPMYRSVSRSSLTGDYQEGRVSEFGNLRKPEYYLSMEELVERRRQEAMRVQGLELVRMIREAEQQGFTADDIQVALNNCGQQNPLEWLQENWKIMVDNVIALSTSYANDKKENDVGTVSENEAREALRLHKGHIWASVTECVETRQRKFLELKARGKFASKDITDALTSCQGDVELAYAKLTKSTSKPFLMRIWGAGEGVQNKDGALPKPSESIRSQIETYNKTYIDADDVQSDELWDEEEEDVEWDDDSDEQEDEGETEDINLQTCRDDVCINSDITTPDSDRSDYCDAFGTNTLERNLASSPGSDTFFVIPETKQTKKSNGLLSKLAALRKEGKESKKSNSKFYDEETEPTSDAHDDLGEEEQQKSYNPLNVIKNTFSAIRDTVSGSSKSEKKLPCTAPEKRTIIVRGQIAPEDSEVKTNLMQPVKDDVPSSVEIPGKETGAIPKHSAAKTAPKSSQKVEEVSRDVEIQKNLADTDNKVKEIRSALEANSLKDSAESESSLPRSPTAQLKETSQQRKTDELSSALASHVQKRNVSPKNSSFLLKAEESAERKRSPSPKIEKAASSGENFHSLKGENRAERKKSPTFKIEKVASDNKNLHLLKSEEPEVQNKSPTPKVENDDSFQKTDSTNVINSNANSDLNTENATVIKKEKQTLEGTENSKASVEHPPVFSTVKNDKAALAKGSSEQVKEKFEISQKSEEKKSGITIKEENNKLQEENNAKHDQEIQNDIPYIDSSTNADSSVEITAGPSSLNKDEITTETGKQTEGMKTEQLNEYNDKTNLDNSSDEPSQINRANSKQPSFKKQETSPLETKKSSNDGLNLLEEDRKSNEQKCNQVGQVNFPNEFDQASKNNEEISKSNTSEKALKHTIKKFNHQDKETTKESFSNLSKIEQEKSNREAILEQETKETTQIKILQSDDKIVATSLEENETNESKRNSPKSALPTTNANDLNLRPGSSSDANQQLLENKEAGTIDKYSEKTSIAHESHSATKQKEFAPNINDSTVVKASPSQNADNYSKFSVNELNTGHSNETDKPKHTKSPKIQLSEDKVSQSPEVVHQNKENNSIQSMEIQPTSLKKNTSTEAPLTSSEGTASFHPRQSQSNDCATLSIEASESLNDKRSLNDTETDDDHSKNSGPNDSATQLPSLSSEKVASVKVDKKKAAGDVKSSTVKRKVSPAIKSLLPTPTESTPLKNETTTSKTHDESNSLYLEVNKPGTSASTSTSEIISDKLNEPNETPTDAGNSAADPNNIQQNVIPADTPSTSGTVQVTRDEQSETTNQSNMTEKNSKPGSAMASQVKSTKNSETTRNQHSKQTEESTAKVDSTKDSILIAADDERHLSDAKDSKQLPTSTSLKLEAVTNTETSTNDDDDEVGESESSDDSRQSSLEPPSPVEALRNRFEGLTNGNVGTIRPQSPYRRMSFRSTKAAIALERTRDSSVEKPWLAARPTNEQKKPPPKRSIKQQLEIDRKVRQMVADRKVRTYRKAEIVVQLMDMNFEEEEALLAANECSTLELAISFLQQECLLCAGKYPVSQMISMVHCPHKACRECIRAYFTVQIRDRNIMELLCPFCNEPDIFDEDIAQDYFNHLDIMLKKLVDSEIHELFQRKLRDRVLMRDPNFRWCSQCSSGFIAMENLTRLVCPDCNAVMCAFCRRPWEKEHNGKSCEEFAALKDANDLEAQAAGLAKLLTEDGIDCPMCHFRYQLAKGGCMHFRCTQCQHDFCSGCSRPFKMGQKCGVSEFCAKLGLHAHHPRNCLFYLRDKEPQDLQRLLDMSGVKYDRDTPTGVDVKRTCQVLEQKETVDGMLDDCCGKEVEDGFSGLCRIHYVEYLGQLVNKHKVDPIQIFDVDDLELVLRRANIRLPYKRYRETDAQYRERLVKLIEEELPLDKMDGS